MPTETGGMTATELEAFWLALTKDERSMICYAESCAVDGGGLLEGQRMNADDLKVMDKFKGQLWDWGRIPFKLIAARRCAGAGSANWTYWVRLTDFGWQTAGWCRQLRSQQLGPFARMVFDEVKP